MATKKRSRTPGSGKKRPRSTARGSGRTAVAQAPAVARRDAGFVMNDATVEQALMSGEHRAQLEAYFGEENYEELRSLCVRSRAARVRGGPRVLILPGIMGSKLGEPGLLLDDVIWIDPFDIIAGRWHTLRLPDGDPDVKATGVVLLAYLKIKLKLRLAGFDADFHPFDWRQDIAALGAELAQRIEGEAREGFGDVYLVAHSMGGLVARAALKHLQDEDQEALVRRLVMLGTPNFGSFSPVQALSGYHDLVRKVAALDVVNSHQDLVNEVFNTFPGLYQMLPATQRYSAIDLYDPVNWPPTGIAPRPGLLSEAPAIHAQLSAGNERMALIAGIDQETIVGVRLQDDEFVFATSMEGDGTVPLDFARIDGVSTWYVEEKHGSLPNNADVTRAVIDLLETGNTEVLARQWSPSRRGVIREVRGSALSQTPFEGRTGEQISERELRHLLDEFVAPAQPERDASNAPSVTVPGVLSSEPIVIGRKRQSRVDLVVANGDITQLNTRALVLGVFKDVPPAGAARAIDEQIDGAISDFAERRLFRANVGDVFVLPANRSRLRTDMVVFAGLGTYDDLSGELLRQVAENVARVLARTRVDEFGTVLFGAGSGMPVGEVLANLVEGFLRGIGDASSGSGSALRSIVFVENDRERFQQLHQEILGLANTSLFDDLEVTVSLETLPAAPQPPLAPADDRELVAAPPQPVYLLVREMPALSASITDPSVDASFTLRASLLTAGARATVFTDEIDIDGVALNAHLARIETEAFDASSLPAFGRTLAELTLPLLVRKGLAAFSEHPLMVIHDARTSRIPWETINVTEAEQAWFPAVGLGLSRKYEAEDLSVAKWLEERRLERTLSVLLVVNPTRDLPGADEEGKAIRQILRAHPAIEVTELWEQEATLSALRAAFRSGRHDVVHYAGHAFFDPINRTRSGLLCHGKRVFTGAEAARLEHLPALVFFNACESARVRDLARVRSSAERDGGRGTARRIETNIGLAESMLRAGVANYLGTYWPVGDEPAKAFGRVFYAGITAGDSIGEALQAGRRAVQAQGSVDWADYVHYGSPTFRIKKRGA
ncbi:MAG: CHAT domain-containing protein [Gammaproteobacteria bacterium]|nr:CHAT domain-containing protein [Gammaproteobacteria bacterium]